MADLPSHTQVLIIGGGCAGTSALYHLALKGWTDTLLLEANDLTAGSTWHAAGNCPNFSGNWNLMRLQQYSTSLYKDLAETVDYPITYHRTGAVRLAHTKDRMEEFRHVTGMAHYLGLDFEVMSANELTKYFPAMETHDLVGGLWDPDDGDIDPSQLTQAYAKGARDLGARVERFCRVLDIKQAVSGGWIVSTEKGEVTADIVVNAAGYYAPVIGRMVGREVPCVTMEHQYLVTDALPDPDMALPMLRDPDDSYYLRKEREGLILGPYEWKATPAWTDGVPEDFSFQLFPDDLDRLEWYIEQACARVPVLAEAGIRKVINGPVPYTPDGNPLIGPAPGLKNFYEICAFSFGVIQSGGAGKTLAEWIVDGEPEWDLWSLDPRRYTDFATKSYVTAKAIELYQNEYAIHFPAEERPAGRPSKTSPVYERLKAKGAMFGARGGWERATWFPRPGEEAKETLSYHRTNWFEAVGE
ncbi:MAG: FAD-dependent oxidoreductase, partial [Pseudomonadota bacterium]